MNCLLTQSIPMLGVDDFDFVINEDDQVLELRSGDFLLLKELKSVLHLNKPKDNRAASLVNRGIDTIHSRLLVITNDIRQTGQAIASLFEVLCLEKAIEKALVLALKNKQFEHSNHSAFGRAVCFENELYRVVFRISFKQEANPMTEITGGSFFLKEVVIAYTQTCKRRGNICRGVIPLADLIEGRRITLNNI